MKVSYQKRDRMSAFVSQKSLPGQGHCQPSKNFPLI